MVSNKKFGILFVCLGNICRSPLAEGVFRHLVKEEGLSEHFYIDSCGTDAWHQGEAAHPGSQEVAVSNGISLKGITSREISVEDMNSFDLILAMDSQNMSYLKDLPGAKPDKLKFMRDFDTKADSIDVPDPYYAGGFEGVFTIIERSCTDLLVHLKQDLEL